MRRARGEDRFDTVLGTGRGGNHKPERDYLQELCRSNAAADDVVGELIELIGKSHLYEVCQVASACSDIWRHRYAQKREVEADATPREQVLAHLVLHLCETAEARWSTNACALFRLLGSRIYSQRQALQLPLGMNEAISFRAHLRRALVAEIGRQVVSSERDIFLPTSLHKTASRIYLESACEIAASSAIKSPYKRIYQIFDAETRADIARMIAENGDQLRTRVELLTKEDWLRIYRRAVGADDDPYLLTAETAEQQLPALAKECSRLLQNELIQALGAGHAEE